MTAPSAYRRPPHVRRTREQMQALDAALRRLDLIDRERAVLSRIADHADGAGYAWVKVETLVVESGFSRRTVFRALEGLCSGDEPVLERLPFLRSAAILPEHLPRNARQGQGPSTYRLGAALRAAAGLRDVEPVDDLPGPTAGGESMRGTPRIEGRGTPRIPGRGTPRIEGVRGTPDRGTPRIEGKPCTSGGVTTGLRTIRGTPRTREQERGFIEEERLVPSRSEGTLAREERDDETPWHELARRASESNGDGPATAFQADDLPERERKLVAASEVAFPGSAWVGGEPPAADAIWIDLTGGSA